MASTGHCSKSIEASFAGNPHTRQTTHVLQIFCFLVLLLMNTKLPPEGCSRSDASDPSLGSVVDETEIDWSESGPEISNYL